MATRMSNLGSIEAFIPENDWSEYEERLEDFFIANDVPGKKKVHVTISLLRRQAYSTLRDLCLPSSPSTKTFDEICALLRNHYQPKVTVVAESCKLYQTVQLETENVAEFASKVKRARAKCDFGTHLPRALRDQFVIGVKNQATKKKLLSDDKTFEECQRIAIADETADREAKCIENENLLATPVNKIDTNKSEPRKRQVLMPQHKQFNCYRCGSSQHGAHTCKYIKSICHYCHKPGHLESVCFKKQRDEKQKKNTSCRYSNARRQQYV